MENLNELKAIWHTAKTDSLPTSGEMLQLIGKFRSQKLRSKWRIIISSSLLSCLMIAVVVIIPFKLVTTYLGAGLIAASGFLHAANNFRSLKRFYQLDNCSNAEFLAFIEQTRLNQIRFYRNAQVMMVSLSSAGLLLYLYEPTVGHPYWQIAIYSLALAYLAIMWFVVRPRIFRKNAKKLEATRERLESISKQLK